MASDRGSPRLYGVLVTFRRPEELRTTLEALARQTRRLDRLVVVDNAADDRVRAVVEGRTVATDGSVYVRAPENLGPAGGIALGYAEVVALGATDDDWLVVLDDDDPPPGDDLFERLAAAGERKAASDPKLAAVGTNGSRFDSRRGRVIRPLDDELHGLISVDFIAGGQCPLYRVGALRDVGPPDARLFFGLDDLELGLRLRRGGYHLYADGDILLELRRSRGRLNLRYRPRLGLADATWRRYYSLRNLVAILRESGHSLAALRVIVVSGLAKPLANAWRPGEAMRHLRLNVRACHDGWRGRLGRTIDPPFSGGGETRQPPA